MAEAQKRDAAKAQLEMQKWEQRLVDARRRKKPQEIKEAKKMLQLAEVIFTSYAYLMDALLL